MKISESPPEGKYGPIPGANQHERDLLVDVHSGIMIRVWYNMIPLFQMVHNTPGSSVTDSWKFVQVNRFFTNKVDMKKITIALSCISLIALLSGCTKPTSEENQESTSGDNRTYTTSCGTVHNGKNKNPVSEDDGEIVVISQVAGSNSVVIERENGPQLVKLIGLSNDLSPIQRTLAENVLKDNLGSAIFYPSQSGCTVNIGAGEGTVGTLINVATGESLSEELLVAGAAKPKADSECQSDSLLGCFAALEDSATPVTGGPVSDFIWKPSAEKDGNLVVLLNPSSATVFVNGQALRNTGYSNGRGTTARANKSGCAFGSNITVEAVDSQGRALLFKGKTSLSIANGCNRVEF
ncbi:MAG: hypothetical protein KDD55_01460 [Bdellovibrionales bacterium]|nr:hypothetical protein [Bdellovibrionales bacterium]